MCKKARYDADLHCHTTASDGLLSPTEVVELAKGRGVQAIGIADHDTVDGLEEAEEASRRLGIQLVKGIEINTDWEGKEVHILGYEMDLDSPGLMSKLQDLREKRISRIHKILEKLGQLGIIVNYEQVEEYVSGESAGRPHVAQALIKHGHVSSVREAFDKYLKHGAPAYVPRDKLSPVQAIQMIRKAGGVAVLAHPGSQQIEQEIYAWVESGLQGIEVSHPDHSLEYSLRYRVLSERMNILATGGSDFHGHGIKPGIDLGDWGVEMETVRKIKQLAKKTIN